MGTAFLLCDALCARPGRDVVSSDAREALRIPILGRVGTGVAYVVRDAENMQCAVCGPFVGRQLKWWCRVPRLR